MIFSQLLHGDMILEIPAMMREFDLVLTSPPYGIGKEYEKWKDFDEYIDWLHHAIATMSKAVGEKGVLALQTGYHVGKNGFLEPLDFHVHDIVGLCDWTGEFKMLNRIIWHFGHGLHCKKRLSGRHEVLQLYSRSELSKFNLDKIRVPQKYPAKKHYKGPNKGKLSGKPLGKNPSDVWEITNVKNNHPEKTAHPCQFPEELVRRVVLAYTDRGDVVMDPFMGSGTVGKVCRELGRSFVGIEKNKKYFEIAEKRIHGVKNELSD